MDQLQYSNLDVNLIEKAFEDILIRKELYPIPILRHIRLQTGVSGADMFQETVENKDGFNRVYIGKKVPGILNMLKMTIKKSLRGRYYKLVKTK